jgi:hypothetical protein
VAFSAYERAARLVERTKPTDKRRANKLVQQLLKLKPNFDAAGEYLRQSLNPRNRVFPKSFEWDVFRLDPDRGIRANRGHPPEPGWAQEVALADASPSARQALLTIGLALADLRGDEEYFELGRKYLSSGAWNLWDGMSKTDRAEVQYLLSHTKRIWGWPSGDRKEPGRFNGLVSTFADHRIFDSDWRSNSTASLSGLNDLLVATITDQRAATTEWLRNTDTKAPINTPRLLKEAYESVATAFTRATVLKSVVLPSVDLADTSNWQKRSELTRKRTLDLPWGRMAVEAAFRQCVAEIGHARVAFGKAEQELLAAAKKRSAFHDALAWLDRVQTICNGAMAGKRRWDQAAISLMRLPDSDVELLMEGMRAQTARAGVIIRRALPDQLETDFEALAPWAENELAGNEKRAVIELCNNGGIVPLATFTHLFEWQNPIEDSWKGLQRRLNEKLKSKQWVIRRKDNAAVLTKSPVTRRRAPKKTPLRRRCAPS